MWPDGRRSTMPYILPPLCSRPLARFLCDRSTEGLGDIPRCRSSGIEAPTPIGVSVAEHCPRSSRVVESQTDVERSFDIPQEVSGRPDMLLVPLRGCSRRNRSCECEVRASERSCIEYGSDHCGIWLVRSELMFGVGRRNYFETGRKGYPSFHAVEHIESLKN